MAKYTFQYLVLRHEMNETPYKQYAGMALMWKGVVLKVIYANKDIEHERFQKESNLRDIRIYAEAFLQDSNHFNFYLNESDIKLEQVGNFPLQPQGTNFQRILIHNKLLIGELGK